MPNNSNNVQWIENKTKYKPVLDEISDAISAFRATYKNEELNQIGWWFHGSSTNLNGWSSPNVVLNIENENLIFNAKVGEIKSPNLRDVPPFYKKQPIGQDSHRYFKIRCKATENVRLTFYFERESMGEEPYFYIDIEGENDYVTFELDMSGFEDWAGYLEGMKIISNSSANNCILYINYLLIDKISTFYDLSKYMIEYIKPYKVPESADHSMLTKYLIEDIKLKMQNLSKIPFIWENDIIENKTSHTHKVLSDIKARMSLIENSNYGWPDDCDAYNCTCDQECYNESEGCFCDNSCHKEAYECECYEACYEEHEYCKCYGTGYYYECECNQVCFNHTAQSCECDTTNYELNCNCDETCYNHSLCSCDESYYSVSGTGCDCDGECYSQGICSCDESCDEYTCSCHMVCHAYIPESCDCNVLRYNYSCLCNNTCFGDTGCLCDNECYEEGDDCTCDSTCYEQGGTCECDQQKYNETCWTCNSYIP